MKNSIARWRNAERIATASQPFHVPGPRQQPAIVPGECFEYTVAVCESAIAREFVVCGYAVDERHMTLRAPVLEASRDIRFG